MLDWNDLKLFLAVARHGSTTAAARALGVNQSTVQRRIAELEHQLGRPLVIRRASGYELTPLARALTPCAEDVAKAVDSFERCVRATAPDGRHIIRLTCPEPVVGRLTPLIERFQLRHPAYQIEFITSDHYVDLLAGEADVAFRSGDTDDALVGLKVADSIWAVYASASYLEKHGRPATVADLNQHTLVSLDDSLAKHRLVTWIQSVAPHATVASRSNSILGLVQAAKSGIGIAPLPMAIAEEAQLIKVLGPIRDLARSWKLLTHPGLRGTPGISAFFDFVVEERDYVSTVFR